MARGADSKAKLTEQILSNFEGAFIASDGKTIRVPFVEDNERVEIKISLVAAKDCERDNEGTVTSTADSVSVSSSNVTVEAPSQEELDKVKTLLEVLNF